MLDKLTRETFEPLKSDRFQLSLGDREPLALELAAVLGNGLKAGEPEQFSLHFRGALPALPQRIYRLEHGQLGRWISSWCRSPAMPRG